jgi:hypothetical protein
MQDEREKYCDEMRELFSTPGWLWLVAECQDAINQANNVDDITTEASLWYAKGSKSLAQQLISLPDQVKALEEELEDEKDDASA